MGFLLAALVLWGVPSAETPQWSAPPTCPEQTVVDGWIDRLVLEDARGVPSWQGHIDGSADAGFTLTMTVSGRSRTVADSDCERLAVAAALIVAVAADPVAVADVVETQRSRAEPPPPPPPPPTTPAEPLPPAAASAEDSPRVLPPGTPSPPRAWRPEVRGLAFAAVGAELAVLPRPGFAASLGGGLSWSSVRLEVAGLMSVPRDIEVRDSTLGARAAVAGGQVRGCWVVDASPLEVPLCLAGEVGAVWARGFGPSIEAQARTQAWAAAVPSLGVTGWLSERWGLEARISVPVGLYKPAVHLGGVDVSVFRAGSVGTRLWVGPILRFP